MGLNDVLRPGVHPQVRSMYAEQVETGQQKTYILQFFLISLCLITKEEKEEGSI